MCSKEASGNNREMMFSDSDMTSSSTSTTASGEQCNKSWSEEIEAEEEVKHKVR